MDFVTVETLRPILERGKRLLGLDLGTKTIGLALSDVEHRIASPLRTIQRTKFQQDAAEIQKTCLEFNILALVLGLPRNMDGSDGPRVQATKAFARNLHKLVPVPILLWDERLSTVAAERVLLAADLSRKKRGEVIDKTAAAFILQGALDAL